VRLANNKPHELRIAVNGSLVSSLKVSSILVNLILVWRRRKGSSSSRSFSEQGVQLLFFPVSQRAAAEDEQWAEIQLSEGRRSRHVCASRWTAFARHLLKSRSLRRSPTGVSEISQEEPLSSPQVSAAAARSAFGRLLRMLGSLAHHRAPDRDTIERCRQSMAETPGRTALSQKK